MKALVANLRAGYEVKEGEDPIAALTQRFEIQSAPTKTDLQWLIGVRKIERGEVRRKELDEDLQSYFETSSKYTPVAIQCAYIHFATSVCHLFGDYTEQDGEHFYPNTRSFIICYGAVQAKPLPYIWVNLNEKVQYGIELVKHNIATKLMDIRFMLRYPNKLIKKVVLDLEKETWMVASRGNFVEINVEKHTVQNEDETFCVLLTNEMAFEGIYHTNKRCSVVFHPLCYTYIF
jgi:hypothetical protein